MNSYKQQVIDIINNDAYKQTLNNNNLYIRYLKQYTEICMDSENYYYEKRLKGLYYEINNLIKKLNYKKTIYLFISISEIN